VTHLVAPVVTVGVGHRPGHQTSKDFRFNIDLTLSKLIFPSEFFNDLKTTNLLAFNPNSDT
jgi:hypothetical protein